MGLVFSVTGYNESIVISFTACSEQIPDPDVFALCLRDSFQEYLALARPSTRGKPRPAFKRPARTVRKRKVIALA